MDSLINFGEKEYKHILSQPPVENFALDVLPPKAIQWDYCREKFAVRFNELTTGFYFSHPPCLGEGIAAFLIKFEKIVALDEEIIISNFSKTDKDTILWIEPSEFWKKCAIKRSLLTILVRCGINYDPKKDNFDEVLFSEKYSQNIYLRETRSALLRFMFGFTKFVGTIPRPGFHITIDKHGWREEFINLSDFMIRSRLVSPKSSFSEVLNIDAIWV
jgi:hypothetical protein